MPDCCDPPQHYVLCICRTAISRRRCVRACGLCLIGVTLPSPRASTYAWPRDSPLAQVCALPSVVCSQSSLNIHLAPGLAFATIVCQTKWPTLCDCIAAESPTHKRTPLTSLEQFASACQTRCQTCLTVLLQASIPHTAHSTHTSSVPVHKRVSNKVANPVAAGEHSTTRLCLQWLHANRAGLQGKHVMDYGTGSGVLAIAALLMGAASAVSLGFRV